MQQLAWNVSKAFGVFVYIDAVNDNSCAEWPSAVVYPFEYPNRQWARKEQSDFGWDWGPAFAPAGPWRDGRLVQLRREGELYSLNTDIDIYRRGQFNNLMPDQSQPWVVNASLDFLGDLPRNPTMTVIIADASNAKSVLYSGPLHGVTASGMTITGSVSIGANEPKLWWPRQMGEQSLYIMSVFVQERGSKDSVLISSRRVGFRTILLSLGNVTQSQIDQGWAPGNNWHFEINGHELYAKGANLVPPDAFWPRVSEARMQRLFESVEYQNHNMLRVWASGAYLPDFIYDMADEKGILLWSEFEFSDTLYPDSDAFKESVTGEVTYNVRRLNHHPSLACWIGGNEFENLELPIAEGADPAKYPYYVGQYENLFITTIFNVLASNSHSISYTPSSANNGWTKITQDPVFMVQRYYNTTPGYIYSDTDFYNYDSSVSFDNNAYPVGRFANEFGFTSMPSLQTWQQAVDPEDLHFNSTVVVLRNHHYPAGGLEVNLHNSSLGMVEQTLAVERYFPTPNKSDSVANFSSWCHATQLFQADMYKSEIQFYRRGSGMPERQRGSLYWQLNDIWQAPSWAGLEYDGRWKAVGYAARRTYQNVIAAPFWNYTTGDLELWVTSDLWESVSGELSMTWIDLDGKPIKNNAGMALSKKFAVGAINTTKVLATNVFSDLTLRDKANSILLLSLTAEGHLPNAAPNSHATKFTHSNHFLPVWPNEAKIKDPGLKLSHDGKSTFTVEAPNGVALYTWLTHPAGTLGFFDDNLFVLNPGEKKHVPFNLQQDDTNGKWLDEVVVHSLWDLGTP